MPHMRPYTPWKSGSTFLRSSGLLGVAFALSLTAGCMNVDTLGNGSDMSMPSGNSQPTGGSMGASSSGPRGGASSTPSGSNSGTNAINNPSASNPSGNNEGNDGTGGGTTAPVTPPHTTPDPNANMPPSSSGNLSLSVSMASDTVRLNETKSYQVTVTPTGGFNGMATLSAEGLPDKVTATFTPPSIMLTDQPQTVQLNLAVASDAAVTANPANLTVKATSGAISATAPFSINIPAELLIGIAKGVDIGTKQAPNTTAFGGADSITVHYVQGLQITFQNNDAIDHRVHSDGALGIPHEPGNLTANGGTYTVKVNGPGASQANDVHCHIHTTMIGPAINVVQ